MSSANPKAVDWKLYISIPCRAARDRGRSVSLETPVPLTEDDKETIHRFHLLQTDSKIRESFAT